MEGIYVLAQLFFMGQVVEWSTKQGVRTGVVANLPRPDRGWARSDVFNLSSPPDPETLAVARRLLRAADLPDDIRSFLRL